jgi:hypothetical protein
MLDPLIREHVSSGSPELLREGLSIVMDWHRYHVQLGKENRFSWYDMSAGQRAAKLAFIIERAMRGILIVSEEEKNRLAELASIHFSELMKEDKIAANNHGIFQVLGLKLLSRVVGGREDAADFADAHFHRIMDLQFTPEGVHTENSPDYHFYTHRTLLKSQIHRHFSDPFGGKCEKIEAIKPWMVFPSGDIARIGDSNGRSDSLEVDPYPTVCNGTAYAVGDFTSSGYAIIRSMPSDPQRSMLFVTGMAHTLDHKHADELSFELFEEGQFVFVDSGKYGYKSDAMREHVRSTDAHNTIGLRDRKLMPETVKLVGSLLRPIRVDDDAFVVEGTVIRPGLFEQRRVIRYSPGVSIVITDDVTAATGCEFVSSLHLAPGIELDDRKNGFDACINGRRMSADLVADRYQIERRRGSQRPLNGWYCEGYLKMVPTNVVRAVVKGTNARIQWHIRFCDD